MRAEPATLSGNTRSMQSAAYSVMQRPQSGPAITTQTNGLSVPAAKHLSPSQGQGDVFRAQGFKGRVHKLGRCAIDVAQKGKGQMQVFRRSEPAKWQIGLNVFEGLNGVLGQTQRYEQAHASSVPQVPCGF
jgi:hypothetical protein